MEIMDILKQFGLPFTLLSIIATIFFLKSNLKKLFMAGLDLLKFALTLYKKYKKELEVCFSSPGMKKDYKELLEKTDKFLELCAKILNRFDKIPKKYVKTLQNLIKKSDYEN